MKDLDKKFKELLEENIGYGFSMNPGELPVQEVGFPEEDLETQHNPQVDPNRPVVTSGETTVAGDSREDYAMEMGQDTNIEEVGSLIITIGHILQQSNLVSDKYNVAEILDYLNHNFEVPESPTEENPPDQMEMPTVPGDACAPPPEQAGPQEYEMSPGYAYMESMRKRNPEFSVIVESVKKKLSWQIVNDLYNHVSLWRIES